MTSLPTPMPARPAASDAPGGAARSWSPVKKEGPVARTPRLDFAQALKSLEASRPMDPGGPWTQVDSASVEVRRGQTLTSIVRERWAQLQGSSAQSATPLSDQQAHRWALQVARDNGLADPNRILPGQRLTVAGPHAETLVAGRGAGLDRPTASSVGTVAVTGSVAKAMAASKEPAAATGPTASGASAVAALSDRLGAAAAHPVLDHTLDRAVARGYMPAEQRQAVQQRIQALADKHGFRPDDFARATLMESDGMNPRANNGRCFGIIQFCSGPDRGAASAGYGRNAQDILKLSVLDQLDLVDRYFDDTRLGQYRPADGAVRLDDLYLTILMPAARQERRLNAALPIPGPQALDLHAQRDRLMPITRQSILSGLYANARDRLGQLLVAASGK